jgi:CrcB protein
MRNSLLVFLGAGRGGVLRHFVNLWSRRWLGLQFPWGVLVINVSGSVAFSILGLFPGLSLARALT